jgi:hypothetical protein
VTPPKMSEHRLWGFDEEERAVLLSATTELPDLAELVKRATPHKEIAGVWIVWATGHELDEVYSLVEALEHGVRGRKRRELLKGMRMSLCSSMDGF